MSIYDKHNISILKSFFNEKKIHRWKEDDLIRELALVDSFIAKHFMMIDLEAWYVDEILIELKMLEQKE